MSSDYRSSDSPSPIHSAFNRIRASTPSTLRTLGRGAKTAATIFIALEAVKMVIAGGAAINYRTDCRTVDQRASNSYYCDHLARVNRDFSRGTAAVLEHGVYGLVRPPSRHEWTDPNTGTLYVNGLAERPTLPAQVRDSLGSGYTGSSAANDYARPERGR